ncbi:MAG: NADAR family protein [Candidatus Methanomethylophilaceae archaeon]|nr:NADAR family protein [Candidatus Methanomethylophilaceae archaeon]
MAPGWDQEKADVMADIVREKFRQHSDLAARLLATGDEYLEERNSWEDRFWGTDMDGQGQNVLGTILMAVRDELRAEASGTGKKPSPGGLRGFRHREADPRFQNTFKVYSKYMELYTW